jgi:hypothetical protein
LAANAVAVVVVVVVALVRMKYYNNLEEQNKVVGLLPQK